MSKQEQQDVRCDPDDSMINRLSDLTEAVNDLAVAVCQLQTAVQQMSKERHRA